MKPPRAFYVDALGKHPDLLRERDRILHNFRWIIGTVIFLVVLLTMSYAYMKPVSSHHLDLGFPYRQYLVGHPISTHPLISPVPYPKVP